MTLKELSTKCLQHITVIFNSCLHLSHFPSQWKFAEIILVPKPNKPENDIGSYRPISLLSILSKVFEKIILRRVMPILDQKNAIPDHQFGFRAKHGTPEQVHRIVRKILDGFESKQYCSAVFLDIKQAFDKVWHNGLLFKIKRLLPAPLYVLLKSYLTNREFTVRFGGENSEIKPILAGVPQGSVLGPILYSIYTADMPTLADRSLLVATYADDTAILSTSASSSSASSLLQTQLDELEKWLDNWNIVVNKDKSSHVTFSLRKGDCSSVCLHNVPIPSKQEVSYLGMKLDRRLCWKPHIASKRK